MTGRDSVHGEGPTQPIHAMESVELHGHRKSDEQAAEW